ncbi:unnamed protein product [Spirodela intermedia]|uniref:Uncharacterized protein n=1 Tax=Spirodela intermedia TaxID=51605 RepID=A0A7I8IIL8_SPIIN|nr:unnamed protein product [Spirodela intermedia]CAA6657576.1 unnamed protein product [Spirodela intermedia]
MNGVWQRAVEAALEEQADPKAPPTTLTLDGAVKCLHGWLPSPRLLEKFQSLEHLSIANVGVSSLENFPRLRNLQRLILSDNRIAGGLEFLVRAGLNSLRDLDLSNNRIQFLQDLAPLAQLRLVSLDLYECPVTRIKDYRSEVFGMIRSLKYLDKVDADDNERPETDDEEEDDEDEEDEEDPGSGEIDGEDRTRKPTNGTGHVTEREEIVDVDEDEEGDADEEEVETGARSDASGSGRDIHHLSNGFRVAASVSGRNEDEESDDSEAEDEEYTEDYDDEEDLGEEIHEEEGGDDGVPVIHEIDDSEDEDGIEEDEDVEEVDAEDDYDQHPGSTSKFSPGVGDNNDHEQSQWIERGLTGRGDDHFVEDEGESEDEYDEDEVTNRPSEDAVRGGDLEAGDEENSEQEEADDDGDIRREAPGKRSRDEDNTLGGGSVEDSRLPKRR